MAATIKIKNSSTAGAAPTSSDLVQGELAVNVTDKRLYTENSSGTVVELGTNPSVPVTFPDGSASAPSLTNDGDTNTGLFFPAADTIALTTGGTERLRLDSSGNLGIGTTSPLGVLDVASSSNPAVRIRNTSTGGAGIWFVNSTSGTTTNDGSNVGIDSSQQLNLWNYENTATLFATNNTERARIDASGNLLVGVTSSGNRLVVQGASNRIFVFTNGSAQDVFYSIGNRTMAAGESGTYAAGYFTKDSSSGRSVNAAGTINASGADYAEYMTKAGDFTVAKGDVVGVNAEGKLTNVFADAVSFVVKSTDPSYVGGDVWGSEASIGLAKVEIPADDASDEEKAQYEVDKAAFDAAIEAARALVDRIAFAGQVPVNVTGATPGQFIIPVNDNGAIKGQAISNPTFEQYQIAVGKVIAIEQDGRARIIVKVA